MCTGGSQKRIDGPHSVKYSPPIDFLEECRKRWENRMNPFTGTVERKIGNTWYLLETVCDGNEPLTHKVKRLIFSDKEALCS